MTEFAIYLDDAGHPDDQPFLAVAGYVASETGWLDFERDWRDVLRRFNLGEEFHMTDFMSRPCSRFKREQILYAISSTINKHIAYPFVCGMDLNAYKRVNVEYALEECHGAPFALTARSVARQINLWQKATMKTDDHLLSFIEQGTKHYGDLLQVFKRDNLPLPAPVPKAIPAAQAADVIAWETFEYLKTGRFSKNLRHLTQRFRKRAELGGVMWESDLRRICADTDVYLRSTLNPGDTIRFHSERKRIRRRTIQ